MCGLFFMVFGFFSEFSGMASRFVSILFNNYTYELKRYEEEQGINKGIKKKKEKRLKFEIR
jgi:hypothetical protein